ncbi:hypothetical protein [Actinoallomurus iriomotensis]|nr:hypothetical protein [Actinoallomurus iriomotensis]
MPRGDATNHRLTVDGLADRPMTYALDALRALRFTCFEKWEPGDVSG